MISKMNAKALVRLAEERVQQAAHRAHLANMWQKKVLALALCGDACVGCAQHQPEQVFLALPDELLDATCARIARGREYVLASRWHEVLYDRIIAAEGQLGYAVFCWDCFRSMGRVRRKALGIYHPRSTKYRERHPTEP